ncbi:MAG: CPBP family intramembrane metalloprotease [Chitinophagaceae bacterium]|nr:CPBP family intramembrane metalloprotease [Chitinophagaceae bacterium]
MRFLENALGAKNEFWRYLILILASFLGGQLLGAVPLMITVFPKLISGAVDYNAISMSSIDFKQFGISKNLGFVLMMLPFVTSIIIFYFLVKPIHSRSIQEVINGRHYIRWKRFFSAFIIWFTIMSIMLLIDFLLHPTNFKFQFSASTFFTLLFLSAILIPLQTAYEEILFRGYLTQGIGRWFKNRYLAILIPGVLFGLLHIANPEITAHGFWLAMPQYVLFGLLFGLISVLDDGIELSMGAHAANNFFLSVFLTNASSALQTDALIIQSNVNAGYDLMLFVIIAILFMYILARIYKWNFSILNKKISNYN